MSFQFKVRFAFGRNASRYRRGKYLNKSKIIQKE